MSRTISGRRILSARSRRGRGHFAAAHRSSPREGGFAGSALRAVAPAPKEARTYQQPPMRGRPAPNRALPGRSRPPSAAVQRRKLFPAPTAKSKLNQINSIKYLPSLACGAAPRPRLGPAFYIYLRLTGGRSINETPPRRPLLRPPRWSFLLMFGSHRGAGKEDHKERARPGAPGSRVAVAPGLAPALTVPAHS